MKKVLLFTLLLMLIMATACSAESAKIYSFNSQEEIDGYPLTTRDLEFSFEDGFLKFVTTGADPSVTHHYGSDAFDVADYRYLKYRYRLDAPSFDRGQVFFKTDTSPTMGQSGSGTYTYFDISGDDMWHTVVVDMTKIASSAWSGVLQTLRIDPISVASADQQFTGYIDYIALFTNQEEANLYASEAQKAYDSEVRTIASQPLITTVEKEGVKVLLTAWSGIYDTTPEDKYIISNPDLSLGDTVTVTYADGTSKLLALSCNTGDKYVYLAQGEGSYAPSRYSKSFSDTSGHWAKEYIDFVSARQLFGGTSETEFSPDMTMTRGMYLTVLGRMHGVDTSKYTGKIFNDVNENEYYNPYIKWAAENGIISGDANGNFHPEEAINRLDMAIITANYIKSCSYDLAGTGSMMQFDDLGSVSVNDLGAIYMMQRVGIINGRTPTSFDPQGIMTRAEVSAVISRLVKAVLGVNEKPDDETVEYGSDPVIFKFDTLDDISGWSYDGDVVRDPATSLPPMITEGDQSFVRLQNVNYMTATLSKNFDISKNHFMSFKYRRSMPASDMQYCYVYTDYFRENQNGYEHQKSSALIRIGRNIPGDGEWHTITVDMASLDDMEKTFGIGASNAVQGVLENLRFDWRTYAEGEYIDLAYIGFFDSREAADSFQGSSDASWGAGDTVSNRITPENITSYYPYKSNKLLIGAYDVAINNEEDVKLLAQAGLNFVQTSYGSITHRNNVLKWCYQYDIDVVFFNRGLSEPFEPRLKTIFDGAETMPNFLGNNITDEPGASRFATLEKIVNASKAYAPDKYTYINLFPNYASARQLEGYPEGMTEAEMSAYDKSNPATMTYIQHLEKFVADIPENDLISVDIYPFLWSGNVKKTRDNYMQGLAELGKVARENNKRLAVIMQAVNYSSGVRQPSTQDGRYQAYASMAFGADMLSYYTYCTRPNENGVGMLDRQGVPSVTYYNLQPVNFELQRISDVFMQYKSLGAFTVNVAQSRRDLYFTEQYGNEAVKPALNTSEPVLVGCFEKKEGSGNAYILLNGTDLQQNKAITVSVKFPGNGSVTAYPFGTATVLTPDADGYCSITLESGQGVLVTVD